MRIEAIRNSSDLTAEILHDLRLSVGWPSSVSNCQKELANTYSNFSVWDEGYCIGYVNTISDGASDALINNLIVRPEYQNRGIGTKIISTLISELRADGVNFFNAVFEPKLEEFYRRQGFTPMSAGIMDFYDLSKATVPEGWHGVEGRLKD